VLEVAFGPGYLAIELARLGRFAVTGLDISHTFVKIASQNAKDAGVTADFHQGDPAVMPFDADSFDLIVCQAAFKNFVHPSSALSEMYRVLPAGGTAVIQDMSRDASHADIEREVKAMQLGGVSSFTTKGTLEMLKRRAYSPHQFERLAAESPFQTCAISTERIGLEVRLTKQRGNPMATLRKHPIAALATRKPERRAAGSVALGAVAGPILFTLGWFVLGFVSPGYTMWGTRIAPYSVISQPLSGLGLGPTGPFMNSVFILSGLLMVAGVVGVFRSIPELSPAARWIGTILLALPGLGAVIDGVFTLEHFLLHFVGFGLALTTVVGFPVIGYLLRQIPSWRGFGSG
jgi:SAM-dependent methyltransferase